MSNYLESKLEILQSFRKKKFNEYHKKKTGESRNGINRKENPLFETQKINEIMNKNTLKIEK